MKPFGDPTYLKLAKELTNKEGDKIMDFTLLITAVLDQFYI